MAMLRPQEIRQMDRNERRTRLRELRTELLQARGVQAMGGSTPNPGKIRTLRRQIARILTIEREEELAQ